MLDADEHPRDAMLDNQARLLSDRITDERYQPIRIRGKHGRNIDYPLENVVADVLPHKQQHVSQDRRLGPSRSTHSHDF